MSLIERYRRSARRTVVGVMSGTSLDGIDVAVCSIEGTGASLRQSLVGFACAPFAPSVRNRLLAASAGSMTLRETFELEADLGAAYADAISSTLTELGIPSVDAVGLHGQTVYHAPDHRPAGVTVQLAGGATVAARIGAIVVEDFRAADVAAGGQGAPLVPYCDLALLRTHEANRVALNLGGIANLTWLPRDADATSLIAFDTGPANVLCDAAMRLLFDREFDADGAVAGSAAPDEHWLRALIDGEPYFRRPAPKSTGRELFGEERGRALAGDGLARGLAPATIVATLAALTAATVADAIVAIRGTASVDELIVGGGGARNRTIMRMLAERLPGTAVVRGDDVGLPADAKEAICFALLANEAICETPANVPSATGARAHVVCGVLRLPPVGLIRR